MSVPYSQPYNFTSQDGWQINPDFFLYYNSTHWITDLVEGPDREPWYQITDELYGPISITSRPTICGSSTLKNSARSPQTSQQKRSASRSTCCTSG